MRKTSLAVGAAIATLALSASAGWYDYRDAVEQEAEQRKSEGRTLYREREPYVEVMRRMQEEAAREQSIGQPGGEQEPAFFQLQAAQGDSDPRLRYRHAVRPLRSLGMMTGRTNASTTPPPKNPGPNPGVSGDDRGGETGVDTAWGKSYDEYQAWRRDGTLPGGHRPTASERLRLQDETVDRLYSHGLVVPNQPLPLTDGQREQARGAVEAYVREQQKLGKPLSLQEREIFNALIFNYGLQLLDDGRVVPLDVYLPMMQYGADYQRLTPNVPIPESAVRVIPENLPVLMRTAASDPNAAQEQPKSRGKKQDLTVPAGTGTLKYYEQELKGVMN